MCVTSPPIRLHQRHPVGLPLSIKETRVTDTPQGLPGSTGLNENKPDPTRLIPTTQSVDQVLHSH